MLVNVYIQRSINQLMPNCTFETIQSLFKRNLIVWNSSFIYTKAGTSVRSIIIFNLFEFNSAELWSFIDLSWCLLLYIGRTFLRCILLLKPRSKNIEINIFKIGLSLMPTPCRIGNINIYAHLSITAVSIGIIEIITISILSSLWWYWDTGRFCITIFTCWFISYFRLNFTRVWAYCWSPKLKLIEWNCWRVSWISLLLRLRNYSGASDWLIHCFMLCFGWCKRLWR